MTSLNAPGFSLTLLNATGTGNAKEVLSYIDAPADVLAWGGGHHSGPLRSREEQLHKVEAKKAAPSAGASGQEVKGALAST
jgi:hypothetical protein